MEKRVSGLETRVAVLDNRESVSEKRIYDLEVEMKEFRSAMSRNQGGIAALVILVPFVMQLISS